MRSCVFCGCDVWFCWVSDEAAHQRLVKKDHVSSN